MSAPLIVSIIILCSCTMAIVSLREAWLNEKNMRRRTILRFTEYAFWSLQSGSIVLIWTLTR